jgi:hypothetical protein
MLTNRHYIKVINDLPCLMITDIRRQRAAPVHYEGWELVISVQ